MLKKILITLAILLAIVAAGIVLMSYLMTRGPDLKPYLALLEPRLIEKPDQTMLVVEARGDPNLTGAKAYNLLFKTYFKLVKGQRAAVPRARWPKPLETPASEWIGLYALPLPPGARLAQDPSIPGFRVYVDEWKYGPTAEILHIGSYAEEAPAIERLRKFIQREGYRIAGPHEEEYLKGPGMFGKGDPNKYYTIIRYRVEPVPAEKAPEKPRKKRLDR